MGWPPAPLRGGGGVLLDSAVMRPQMAAHDERADLIRQAVLLGVGISQAQACLDGNTRTALFGIVTFLEANNGSLSCDDLEMARVEKAAEPTD